MNDYEIPTQHQHKGSVVSRVMQRTHRDEEALELMAMALPVDSFNTPI